MNSFIEEVDAERRAECAQDAIRRSQREHAAAHRRPAALTAREALAALSFETLVVWVAAGNLANGVELSDEDRARLTLAVKRIDALSLEVCG